MKFNFLDTAGKPKQIAMILSEEEMSAFIYAMPLIRKGLPDSADDRSIQEELVANVMSDFCEQAITAERNGLITALDHSQLTAFLKAKFRKASGITDTDTEEQIEAKTRLKVIRTVLEQLQKGQSFTVCCNDPSCKIREYTMEAIEAYKKGYSIDDFINPT